MPNAIDTIDIEVKQILNLTDEELLEEFKKNGEVPKEIALHLKAILMRAILNLVDNECLSAQDDLSEEWIADAKLHLIEARRYLSTLRNVLKDLK